MIQIKSVDIAMHENFNKKVYKGEASNTMDISPSTTRIMVKVGEEEAIIINLATQEEDLQIEVVGTIGTQINSSRPQCQVCEKLSHVAFDSWHSFDQDFQYRQHQNTHNSSSMSAMVSAPYSTFDTTWYLDSGATDHLSDH